MSSRELKKSKFSLVLRTRDNSDVYNTLDEYIFGIHIKKVKYPLYTFRNQYSLMII